MNSIVNDVSWVEALGSLVLRENLPESRSECSNHLWVLEEVWRLLKNKWVRKSIILYFSREVCAIDDPHGVLIDLGELIITWVRLITWPSDWPVLDIDLQLEFFWNWFFRFRLYKVNFVAPKFNWSPVWSCIREVIFLDQILNILDVILRCPCFKVVLHRSLENDLCKYLR